MFAEAVCKFSPCFSYVDYFAQCAGYVVDDIGADACKSIIDVNELFKSRDLGAFWMKQQVLHRERVHLKVPGRWSDFSALLTRKLPMFLSCLNSVHSSIYCFIVP